MLVGLKELSCRSLTIEESRGASAAAAALGDLVLLETLSTRICFPRWGCEWV